MDLLSGSPLFGAAVLVAARIAGLFLAVPFFRSHLLGWRLKLGLLGLLSLCVLSSPLVTTSLLESSEEVLARLGRPLDGWLLLASEVLLGVVLGWTSLLVLALVRGASGLIAQQAGLAAASVADPQGGGAETPLPFLFESLTVFLFLVLDLHHGLIRVLVDSYATTPPGSVTAAALPAVLTRVALELGPDVVAGAFILALPVCLALGVVSLAQGLLGRVLPEAELFTLGLPVRVFVGITVLVVGLPAMSELFGVLLETAVSDGEVLLRSTGG